MQFRQGDIFLNKCDKVPELDEETYLAVEGASQDDLIILAHGEATGHKHAIKNDGRAILMKAKDENKFYLMIVKDTELNHEEHATINLPAGNYEVIRQREYTATANRWVAD